jgi:hypothetical protein
METESALASLPVVILAPVVGAAVGAAWAASLPIREVVRNGIVVAQASFWHILGYAILGVLIGTALVICVTALGVAALYSRRGDPTWGVEWHLADTVLPGGGVQKTRTVALVCKGSPPVSVATLGNVEAVVRRPPAGDYYWMPNHGLGDGGTNLWIHPTGTLHGDLPRGKWEIRWYGTTPRRRRFEIARSKYENDT